jgi:hypothetical protein
VQTSYAIMLPWWFLCSEREKKILLVQTSVQITYNRLGPWSSFLRPVLIFPNIKDILKIPQVCNKQRQVSMKMLKHNTICSITNHNGQATLTELDVHIIWHHKLYTLQS